MEGNLKAFFESVIRFIHSSIGGLLKRQEILIDLIYKFEVEVIILEKKYLEIGEIELSKECKELEIQLRHYYEVCLYCLEYKDKFFTILNLLKFLNLLKSKNSSIWRVLVYFITEYYFTYADEFESIEILSFEIDFLYELELGEEDPNYFFHELPFKTDEVVEITKEEFYGKN